MGYGERTPALLDVLEAMTHAPTADWVRQAYVSSFARVYFEGEGFPMDPQVWPRAHRLLDALPEAKALHKKYDQRIRANDKDVQRSSGSATLRP